MEDELLKSAKISEDGVLSSAKISEDGVSKSAKMTEEGGYAREELEQYALQAARNRNNCVVLIFAFIVFDENFRYAYNIVILCIKVCMRFECFPHVLILSTSGIHSFQINNIMIMDFSANYLK